MGLGPVSIDCLALTRLDKSPRGAKQKRIKTLLHEDDDLICQVTGGHKVQIVRCCFVGVWFSLHLIQPLRFADFNSCCSQKLTARYPGFFRMGGPPSVLFDSRKHAAPTPRPRKWEDDIVPLFSRRSWRIAVCDKALIVGPFDLFALVPYCSVSSGRSGQEREQN
jgi:hypothetical protein